MRALRRDDQYERVHARSFGTRAARAIAAWQRAGYASVGSLSFITQYLEHARYLDQRLRMSLRN